MTTLIIRNPTPGSYYNGTPSADRIIIDWASGITVFGGGGNDDIRSNIPNPYAVSAPTARYATMYGDQAVRGSEFPARFEGDLRGNDTLAGGYGWVMKGGPGRDDYEVHGAAPLGPLVCRIPQIDIARDTLLMDHSDESRGNNGWRFSDWDVIRLDADSFRVRAVTIHSFSDNPIVGDQWVRAGFLPTGHGEAHTYFDVEASTPTEARIEANAELHHMAQEGDMLL